MIFPETFLVLSVERQVTSFRENDHAETWAGRKLAGFRNIPAADQAAVLAILIRLGHMAIDLRQLAEIEVNPLLILAEGATAVDARAAPLRI